MEYTKAIETVNAFAKQFIFFEFSVYHYSKELMIIAGSDSSIYYHNLEIHLTKPFHISSKTDWIADVDRVVIEEPAEEELRAYNIANRIEVGNRTIRFIDKDGLFFYFSFAEIEVIEKVVKYYEQ